METNESNEPIVINLDEERDAYVVSKPEDIIYKNEYKRIKSLLKDSLESARSYGRRLNGGGNNKNSSNNECRGGSELLQVRKHDTIMLAGVRGSGKTTFMLSILAFIRENKIGIENSGDEHMEGEIETLQILDPTLIEDKTHIFVNIISMIKNKVDAKAKKANCFSKEESELSRDYMAWEKSFRKLAEGLPSIGGVGADGFTTDQWLDAEFITGKGIRMADAANSLEKAFHEFVRQSLKFIGKTAFILCFDDIDTNFPKGWPVLETLHKYLTTPQVITIISGDPSLYSILIRDQQWKNFSVRLLRMEATDIDDRQKFKETVAHLEEQYFLKLLKPERRIFLNSLYRMEQQKGKGSIIVEGIGLPPSASLRECYNELLKTFGIHSGGQQESFYRFLASTPLRTQKQILYAYANAKTENGMDLGNSIIDIFWSDLAEKKVDVSNLRNAPHYTVPQIVDYLIRNNILIEGDTLTPLFSDHCINSAQFALGAIITDRIKKDPTLIFEYWLRVCLTRELGVVMEERGPEKTKGPSVENYVEYCTINQLRTPRYVSRLSTSYIRAYLGYPVGQKSPDSRLSYEKGTWHGTLPLRGLALKTKKKSSGNSDRIDSVLNQADYFTRVMGYLPLSGSTNHRGQSLPIYSFYNLLGVLGEIVLVARNTAEKDATKEVRRTIVKNSQYREYPLPSWALTLSSSDDSTTELDEDETEVANEEIERLPRDFARAMASWAKSTEADFVVSPAVLGKIFTRFFYTTNNMDKELENEKSLGNWMHRMVVAFLHSVILVEAMEKINLNNARLDLRNPTKKDNIFIENIKKINASQNKDKLNISQWLVSCPLWMVYMNNEFDCSPVIENANKIFLDFTKQFNSNINNNELHDYHICDTLNKVSFIGNSSVKIDSKQKIISDKKRFSVNDKKCVETMMREFLKRGIIKEYIIKLSTIEVRDILRNMLSYAYSSSSINTSTAKSILKRIKNNSMTLGFLEK